MSRRLRTTIVLFTAGAALTSFGCAQVRPWERDVLARPDMAWDPDPLDAARKSHVYFSKEASALSGASAGGGGCGCN
ncbi:MAG: DUF4266 domain-containing protein [Proteobacteria bacterium]|nr:DUF4266 domain-containing protein [Pseudomonadota bacterium]